MNKDHLDTITEQNLKQLEGYIDKLMATCARLQKENRRLRADQETHVAEHANLIKKHDAAKNKVEQMITRLKSMEDLHE
jgi:cell division protein ZapB